MVCYTETTDNLHHRPPRLARNPKTGETLNLAASAMVHFKPGKEMKERVNATREPYSLTD